MNAHWPKHIYDCEIVHDVAFNTVLWNSNCLYITRSGHSKPAKHFAFSIADFFLSVDFTITIAQKYNNAAQCCPQMRPKPNQISSKKWRMIWTRWMGYGNALDRYFYTRLSLHMHRIKQHQNQWMFLRCILFFNGINFSLIKWNLCWG